MVESQKVESRMVAAGEALKKYKEAPDNKDLEKAFKAALYGVAHAIRDSIASIWATKK